jgi:phosphoribosylglycinamide formyltransferase-1
MSLKIAVMCSGSGSNLQALLDAEAQGQLHAEVVLVVSNRRKAYALERARLAGKEAVHLSPRQFEHPDHYAAELLQLLRMHQAELVCLAGYLKKLPPEVIRAYPGRILNIHPAPLPRFGGEGMYGHHVHEAVLAAGVNHSGPTIHFADEEYDHGPIVAHTPVPVQPDDTPESLARRVVAAEHQLYPRVVAAMAQGKVRLEGGRVVGGLD